MTLLRTLLVGGLIVSSSAWAHLTDKEFAMMDTNKDGKISADEHAAGARKMFEAMDANKDGKVTAAEMEAAHPAITGRKAEKSDMSAADKIKAIDQDGDGMLSAGEHAAGSAAMFAKMDADKDGFLSKAELAAGHASMLKKTAQR
ncbi:MAG TPA: EF-hand domain-containing protein [Telluria sp.]|nr:EF-hand domain-containing protein [Telluria sp.]